MVLKRLFLAVGLFCVSLTWGAGDADWIRDFQRPPASARPQTWWHWMNNCVSLGGIRTELQAIADAGKVRPLEDPAAVEGTSSCNATADAFTFEFSTCVPPA